MSVENFYITQESPWGHEPLNFYRKGLKELKFNKIYQFLKDKKGKFLEIGCGHGKMIYSLYNMNKKIEYSGCDISNEAIDFCKKNFLFGKFFTQDAVNIKINKEYDFVLISDVLEHVDDYRKVLENAHNALKEGGYCIMIVVTESDFNIYKLLRLIKKDWSFKTRGHVNYFSKYKIFNEIEKYFTICKIEYMYHVLSSVFDASLFFMTLNRKIKKIVWQSEECKSKKASRLNKIISFFELVSYYESELFKNIPIFSASQFIISKNKC